MTDRNTNALHGIACPKCKATDMFHVEVRAVATIIDNGAESYENPMWEDDAGTTCQQCGFKGEWKDFQVRKPYSTCTECGTVIFWNGQSWADDDGITSCSLMANHQPRWLTLGELRDRTAHLPDWMPITVGQVEPGGWYNNLHLDNEIPETFDPSEGEASLILWQTDDLDSRQW